MGKRCKEVSELGEKSCSNFPTSSPYDLKCVENTNGDTPCKETEKLCGDDNSCYYPVSIDKRDHYTCKRSAETGDCIEELKKCDDITVLGEKSCSDFPPFSVEMVCVDNKYPDRPCISSYTCEYVNGYVSNDYCMGIPISKKNINTHICLSKVFGCIEKILCESVSDKEIDCSSSNVTVKYENINTHKCVANTNGDTPCKEEEKLCGDDNNCNYPVSIDKRAHYVCKKNEGTEGCHEELKQCDNITALGEKSCSDFPTSSPDTLKCVENTNGDTPCKEKEKSCDEDGDCNYPVSIDKRDHYVCIGSVETGDCIVELKQCNDITVLGEKSCSDFPTSSSDKVCIDSEESDKPCKEMLSCNYAESGAEEVTNDICIKHPISKQNINTHICLADGSKCSEKHLC